MSVIKEGKGTVEIEIPLCLSEFLSKIGTHWLTASDIMEKKRTFLLASEMPVPISRSHTVSFGFAQFAVDCSEFALTAISAQIVLVKIPYLPLTALSFSQGLPSTALMFSQRFAL